MTAAAALLSLACLAAGAALGWTARGNYSVSPNGSRGNQPETPDGSTLPFMVEIVARFPSMMIQGPIVGFGLEVQGILAGDDAGHDDGIDPATGLGYGPPESEQ